MVNRGFKLTEIWKDLPWDGDMPDDIVQAFAEVYKKLDNEKLQKLVGV